MTNLVTVFGGSGFVGKQVVRALAKAGWRIRVAVRKLDHAYDLKPLGDVGQIQVVRCDVRRPSDIKAALEGAEAVVNLVGIRYQNFSESFRNVHRNASDIMAETAKGLGISKFVYVSAIGADAKSGSSYFATKGASEEAIRRHIPEAVILRPSVIFGPQDGFFTSLASQTQILPFMPSIGGAKTRFQPVYVGDVAKAVAVSLSEAHKGKTYELGGAKSYSFYELLTYVGQEIMAPKPLIYLPFIAARLIAMVGDVQAFLTPIPPLLTTDELVRLKRDCVVSKGAKGLKELGITEPVAMEAIVPGYLWRFRKGGQFASMAKA